MDRFLPAILSLLETASEKILDFSASRNIEPNADNA